MVVGSVEVSMEQESGLVIYSDDATTDEIDGANVSGEVLSLYFIQGNEIYSLSTQLLIKMAFREY